MKKILTLAVALIVALCPLLSLAEGLVELPSGIKVNDGVALADVSFNSKTAEELYELAKAEGGTIVVYSETSKMSKAADKFMGISLSEEKEIIYIVTKTEEKNAIMKAVMEKAGYESKAKAVCFSLPVTDTAGLRLNED